VVWAGTRLLVWNYWSRSARAAGDETGALDRADVEPDGIDRWAYDPATDRWTVLPAPRRGPPGGGGGLDGVDRGEVVIASARTELIAGRRRTTTLAGRFAPELARWTPIAPQPRPSGRVLLAWVGGAVVEPSVEAVHDPASDRWLPCPQAGTPEGATRR
jgi:hypothetical protein